MTRVSDDDARAAILVVDDEPTIGEIVSRYLERAGYATRTASDGAQALALAAERRPDLVVLDVMLPGVGGLEVMRRLRERPGNRTPVVLLSARGAESDRIGGLRLGADDYVVKPFSPAELVARVDGVLRRGAIERDDRPPLRYNGIEINPSARRVLVNNAEVTLTAREFDLLLFFARHPSQAFSRSQLMDAVWQHAFCTDTTTVTVHIRHLRAKIEDDPSRPTHLQTVWGVGYRFAP